MNVVGRIPFVVFWRKRDSSFGDLVRSGFGDRIFGAEIQKIPMKRREVWWVNFDPSIGGEIRKKRPAVVVSNDASQPERWAKKFKSLFSNFPRYGIIFEQGCSEEGMEWRQN